MTVTEVLTAATDSVNLINSINSGTHLYAEKTQAELNVMVQRNVGHLETILVYAPVDENDDMPDVAGSSDDKTSYTTAITVGKQYITDNS
jgi:hypothetical protein